MTFQQQVFTKIISQFPDQSDAYKAIAKVLYIDLSNVYRRVQGTIALKLEELEMLVQHFKLTLDDIIHVDEETYSWQSYEQNEAPSFDEMFDISSLIPFTQIPDLVGYYWGSAMDLSHSFLCPELALFAVHVGYRLSWKENQFPYFSLNMLDDKMRKQVKIYHEYQNKFHTVEFFHRLSLNIILGHIKYAYNTNVASTEDCLILLDCLQKTMDVLEEKIARGNKFGDGKYPFEVYYTEQPQIGYFAMGISPSLSFISNTFVPPQLLMSYDPSFVKMGVDYFETLKNKSIKISQAGEKTRRKLFAHYRRQIERTRRMMV